MKKRATSLNVMFLLITISLILLIIPRVDAASTRDSANVRVTALNTIIHTYLSDLSYISTTTSKGQVGPWRLSRNCPEPRERADKKSWA